MTERRPTNCRFRLQDERKPYPRSSCEACGKTILIGLGSHCSKPAEKLAELEAISSASMRAAEKPASEPSAEALEVVAKVRNRYYQVEGVYYVLSDAEAAALVQEKLNERDAAQKKAADYHRGWTTAMMQKNDERARADALEAKLAKVMEALEKITRIENKLTGPDWEEIEEAREIARAALAEIDGETK